MTFAQINFKRPSFPPALFVRVFVVGHLARTCQTVFNFLKSNRKQRENTQFCKVAPWQLCKLELEVFLFV